MAQHRHIRNATMGPFYLKYMDVESKSEGRGEAAHAADISVAADKESRREKLLPEQHRGVESKAVRKIRTGPHTWRTL